MCLVLTLPSWSFFHKGDDFLNDTSWLPGAVLAIVSGCRIGQYGSTKAATCYSIAKVFLKARSLTDQKHVSLEDPQD
jgi:hypothetical protein